ncbi:MAG: DUF6443 domain-containing protein [Sphingobacterium sp.]|jgi:RHS repeat-associated protein|nr:DUF6443 domain-containing protein [Sphingobacterium sp.]
MKSIIKKLIFSGLLLQVSLANGQTVDSAAIYARGRSVQSRAMIAALALPALPNINYTVPTNLSTGQAVSYLPSNSGGAVYANGDVTLLAGGNSGGYVNGIGPAARFQGLAGMVAGSASLIYVSDAGNHALRTYNPQTREVKSFVGPTSSLSGWQDGSGTSARFYKPVSICKDGAGNMFVADRGNNMVRKVTAAGVVSTLAGSTTGGYTDGAGSSARFSEPWGITADGSGNVYVTDENNLRIRKISPTGIVTTFAGNGSTGGANGTGTSASFYGMKGVAADASGNLYVAEYNGCRIRKITPAGVVTTFAGSGSAGTVDGTGAAAGFYFPMAVTVDASGNVYVTQLDNRVRKITPTGVVTSIAGNGNAGSDNGSPLSATFASLNGIYASSVDNIYFGDSGNNQIRWKGTGNGYSINPALPTGLVFDKNTGKISGTPTVAKALTNYTVTAYNAAGSATKVISFAVVANTFTLSTDQNSIVTRTARKPGFLTAASLDGNAVENVNIDIQYFDGLGRPSQAIQWQGSPLTNDVVQYIEYDGLGRESVKYLPHVKNAVKNGSFKTTAKNDQQAYYATTNTWDPAVAKTAKPFGITVFENSSLNRVQEQGAPGVAWQPAATRTTSGRTVVTEYGTNGTNDVRAWTVSNSGGSADWSYYAAGKLYKTVIKDENWINRAAAGAAASKTGTVEEFRDFNGRVVLKRVWETESKALNTYYVYDDFGDLRFVIPPGFPATTTSVKEAATGDFHELVYAYKYDGRRRMVEKKIPGKGWEYLVYNKNDQVILTQDSVQRGTKKWSYTKYDAFGRIASTGIYTNTTAGQTTRAQVQGLADAVTPQWESRAGTAAYTNVTFPITAAQKLELTANYYDDYSFKTATVLPATTGLDNTDMVRGLLTGTRTTKDDGTGAMLSVNYYNKYGRVVETVSDNHMGGVDRITNTYTFTGELETSKRQHRVNGSAAVTTILTSNKYDHVGRLIETWKKVNSQAEVLQSRLSYNEVGQLKRKDLHSENNGINFMTGIDYAYNERGWQTKVSSPIFISQLNYNVNGTTTLTNAQYNGNIAQQQWKHMYQQSTWVDDTFNYGYDALNRLKSGANTANVFKEVLEYDDMGNIRKLTRDNATAISYAYNNDNKSNRLASLSGGITGTFIYDGNGNSTTDRTGMTLGYNHLNLPKTAVGGGRTISYSYDAKGRKLSRLSDVSSIKTQRDYIDGIEYNKVGTAAASIERIATEDGFLLNSSGIYSYYYNLTDHLGNVRVVLKKEGTAIEPVAGVMQRQDYYPFGKTKTVATSIDNKYLYNGKEMQSDLNLGTHALGSSYVLDGQLDYGARFYDAEIGRWNVVDPLAEAFDNVSPYVYGMNNPILMIDPTGMAADTTGGGVMGPIVDVWRNVSNFNFRWPTWTYNVPILGSAAESGNNLADGRYGLAAIYFATSAVELFTWGAASEYKISTKMVSSTAEAGTAKLMLGTTRMRLLRNVKSEQLRKMIKYLYRENAKFGNGSTGAMIREEIKNGTVTSGSGSHMVKAKDALGNMRKLLNGNYGELVESDRKIIFEIVEDLTTGTGLKW